MAIEDLRKPLDISEIEFRVQSINRGGYAIILPYKDARVDMQRLDECVGPMNWKREHTRENKNCVVSIWCVDKKQWVSKEDTGTESFSEAAKGLASDSFKRACFNWGIGRELYDFPVIQIKLNGNGQNQQDEWYIKQDRGQSKAVAGWGLRLKDWVWVLQRDDLGTMTYLGAWQPLNNEQGGVWRFCHGTYQEG